MSKTPLKVLVVDDSNVMRKVVSDMVKKLENYDVTVYEAENGMQAEEFLQMNWLENSPIHLMVSDWMMPEMSGVELLERIRTVEQFKEVPVVMLTAETYSTQIARCIELGVYGYITKPFTKDDLLTVLNKCLDERVFKTKQPEKKAS